MQALRGPLALAPALMAKPWGGRRLAELFDKPLPDDQPYGEAWEVSDRPEGSATVVGGALDGAPLARLVREHPVELMGALGDDSPHTPAQRFPLLFKLLDCRQTLSVQVHPDDAAAAPHGDLGKEEAWVVLQADPDASLYLGLQQAVTEDQARAAIAEDRLQDLLCQVPVRAGDAFHLTPGTVHAIGGGCVLAEIQQSSDITYRLFDWGRVGLDGQPRQLHVEEGLAVSRLEPGDCRATGAPEPVGGGSSTTLVDGTKFHLRRLDLDGRFEDTELGRPLIVCCTSGQARLSAGGQTTTLAAGRTALLAACVDAFAIEGDASVLLARPALS